MWRNRALALVFVAASFAVAERGAWLTWVALPVGYGHLLGGVFFGRRKAAPRPDDVMLVVAVLATSFCAYTAALNSVARSAVLFAMFLLSTWHIVENDLALARAYRRGLRIGPLPRARRHHGVALLGCAGVGVIALTLPDLEGLAGALLTYHAISWLAFFADRSRALPADAARASRLRLVGIHALPLAIGALSYVAWPAFHAVFASPAVYLFWSVAHAVQTAWRRGVAAA